MCLRSLGAKRIKCYLPSFEYNEPEELLTCISFLHILHCSPQDARHNFFLLFNINN